MTRCLTVFFLVWTACSAFAAAPASVPSSLCSGKQHCAETSQFVATITDFRLSNGGSVRLLNVTVHFQNNSAKTIILGYADGTGVAIDDRGNRYAVSGSQGVQGIGRIAGSRLDPQFVLQPGASSDARFQLAWRPSSRDIYGTSWELTLTVREILPLPSGQYQLGAEQLLRFPHLVDETASNAAADTVTTAAVAPGTAVANVAAPATASTVADACAGVPRCYNAGSFVATVESITGSHIGDANSDHTLHITLRIRNTSSGPLVLCYANHTSAALDNLGNTYYSNRAGAPDKSAQGIGYIAGTKADPQFTLQAGQSRDASFDVRRYNSGRQVIGTSFTYHLTLTQLEVLPSNQLRTARDYAVEFPNLTISGGAQQLNDTIHKLSGLFHK